MIIVTGGMGFIGSALVWKLNSLGLTDILVVDQKVKGSSKWKNLEKLKFSDYLESDEFLRQIQKGPFYSKVEVVFHMGACTDTTEADENYLTQNNFQYTKILAEWALMNEARFLYASSAATYGDGGNGYTDDDAVTPRLRPLNQYGLSKHRADLWVLKSKIQDQVAGFKFFNVFGPNEYHKGHMRSVVHKGYGQIKQEGKIQLFKSYKKDFKDGEQVRDFVYVKDVIDVMLWFWKHPNKNGIFNLGTGKANSWNTLAKAIFSALKLKPNIEYIEMPENLKAQYQYFTQADLKKLRAAGYKAPFQKFEDSVRDYVLNYLEKDDPYLN